MFTLFENIGERIKTFVKIIYAIDVVLGVLACLIVPLIFLIDDGDALFLLLLLAIPLVPFVFWLLLFPLYALGELVDGVQAIRKQLSPNFSKNPYAQSAPQMNYNTASAQNYGYPPSQPSPVPDNTYMNHGNDSSQIFSSADDIRDTSADNTQSEKD